jgi:hypothetical protein
MSDELALSTIPPTEAEYAALCAALTETARGRWFLAEYARRNRQADTALVLAAIERIATALHRDGAAPTLEGFHLDLADMAQAIARSREEIAAIRPDGDHQGEAGERFLIVKLQLLLRDLEERVKAMLQICGPAAASRTASAPADGPNQAGQADKVAAPAWDAGGDSGTPAPAAPTPRHPLARLKALSDEEKLALFR